MDADMPENTGWMTPDSHAVRPIVSFVIAEPSASVAAAMNRLPHWTPFVVASRKFRSGSPSMEIMNIAMQPSIGGNVVPFALSWARKGTELLKRSGRIHIATTPAKIPTIHFSRLLNGLTSFCRASKFSPLNLLISGLMTNRNSSIMITKQISPTGMAAVI